VRSMTDAVFSAQKGPIYRTKAYGTKRKLNGSDLTKIQQMN